MKYDRIVVDKHGTSTSPARAFLHGVTPAYLFVRDDGWRLAAPVGLLSAAYRMWADEWIEIWVHVDGTLWAPISLADIEHWETTDAATNDQTSGEQQGSTG